MVDALGVGGRDGERAVLPADQVRVEGGQQARRHTARYRAAVGDVVHAAGGLLEFVGDRRHPLAHRTEREP
jgi:hypothetical protein